MTRSQATPASSQIIALEGMVQRLEQQLAAAQEETKRSRAIAGEMNRQNLQLRGLLSQCRDAMWRMVDADLIGKIDVFMGGDDDV